MRQIKNVVKTILKKGYGACKNFINDVFEKRMYNGKTFMAHHYISVTNCPELSADDISNIDSYWSKYGIKFRDYSWFRLYYASTGIHDPKFISQEIYSYIIWPYYDNELFMWAWKDKNFFERFLPDVKFPDTILRRINSCYFPSGGGRYNAIFGASYLLHCSQWRSNS